MKTPLPTYGSKLFAFITFFLLFYSCKKDLPDYDKKQVAEVFFVSNSENSTINSFINDLKTTNSKREFVSKIWKDFGKPYWQYSDVFKGIAGITIITPIIDESDEQITALLIGVYKDNKLYTHIVQEEAIERYNKINSLAPDRNDYGALFYKFNQRIFNRGPKFNDIVFKNGRLTTYGALLLKENKVMGVWAPHYWSQDTDWYQYDSSEGRWNYIDTTTKYWVDWEYVPDDPYTPPSEPYYPPQDPEYTGGGTPPTSNTLGSTFNINSVYNFNGDKPLSEFPNKCQGIQDIWNTSVANNKEVVGLLTSDGKIITVAILQQSGGSWGGLYKYEGTVYYTYPTNQGAPSQSYAGMQVAAGQYFIPVIATVHTHNPCIQSGGDGITNMTLSQGDQNLSQDFQTLNHYIVGCGGAIGKFDHTSNSPSLLQSGNLSNTCNSIQ